MISASLVYDGKNVTLPAELLPAGGWEQVKAKNQFQGTELEKLAEVAGRICYDSFGVGRSSKDYMAHILEVGHLSVLEHCNVTVELGTDKSYWFPVFLNRPGTWISVVDGNIRATLNIRVLLEWNNWGFDSEDCGIGGLEYLAPSILKPNGFEECRVTHPVTPEESWVTLFITCSRGCSHELIRHGDFTAFSQRSTRYVDESESEWVAHPLLKGMDAEVVNVCKNAYVKCIKELEPLHGRKQARGAARGYLGNALKTEIIMSANCRQWKHVISMRKNPAADLEISELMTRVEEVLKTTRYRSYF